MLTIGFKNSESSSRFSGAGGLATPAALGPGALALPFEADATPAGAVGADAMAPLVEEGDIAGATAAIHIGISLVDPSCRAKFPCRGWGTP
jgi:hypothetical protein